MGLVNPVLSENDWVEVVAGEFRSSLICKAFEVKHKIQKKTDDNIYILKLFGLLKY
jgi:hypothetical protein